MTIEELKPSIVWHYFHELTKIPRPSKKEDKVIQYLVDFAEKNKLTLKKDKAGNVLISKPATKGKENVPTLILQGHVDMVCEKNSGVKHDFDADPIKTEIVGDWLKAKGTTLGADNGLGVAASLAILASDDIAHGPIECLFTVDEETGLTGAHALEKGFLTGDILMNLDTEEEGEIYIGCAGGRTTSATFTYNPTPAPANYFWFKVTVNGLNGGHSGSEIHIGLGNANKILNRYLWDINRKYGIVLAEIHGGNLHNAIAREAHAVVGVASSKKEDIAIALNILAPQIEAELKHVDPKLRMTIASVDEPKTVLDKVTTDKLLNVIYACPHGVINMSADVEGLVETSTNLASVKMVGNNQIVVTTSQRSSSESLKDNIVNMVTSAFLLGDAEVKSSDGYPGWKPNMNSQILKIAQDAYKQMFKTDAKIKAIHAGLECGLFLEKYPNLDMISCGPTITGAHSPDEQVNIPSVAKWWDFILEVIKNIPSK